MITQTSLTAVDAPGRTVDLVCVPYDELSYFTQNPNGERVLPGAFAGADPSGVFLFRAHDHANPIGRAVALWEEPDGLHGTFQIRENHDGDLALADIVDGYLPACSIGFRPVEARPGAQGETVIIRGQLKEVSLLPMGAYDGARVLALRNAHNAPQQRQGTVWHVPMQLRYLTPDRRFCTADDPCENRAAGRSCR